MLNKLFFLICIFFSSVSFTTHSDRVHIVSYAHYLLPGEDVPYEYSRIKNDFNVSFYYDLYAYVKAFTSDSPDLKKIIFFDHCEDPATKKLPYSKMICFKWEAIKIRPDFYDFYYRVYTFDDDLVDNVKFFKFYYPVLQPMIPLHPSFEEKSLCVMIAASWIPERIALLDFFAKMPQDSLHFYGRTVPSLYRDSEMNKGIIQGFHSGPGKLETLKNYKFCICFENTHNVPGYITEKIFDAFAAGCIPIYWGPDNVEKYIPADCFINYTQFKNIEEMYTFITSMNASEYEQYINNIQAYLQSDKAYLFSQDNFEKTIYNAVAD